MAGQISRRSMDLTHCCKVNAATSDINYHWLPSAGGVCVCLLASLSCAAPQPAIPPSQRPRRSSPSLPLTTKAQKALACSDFTHTTMALPCAAIMRTHRLALAVAAAAGGDLQRRLATSSSAGAAAAACARAAEEACCTAVPGGQQHRCSGGHANILAGCHEVHDAAPGLGGCVDVGRAGALSSTVAAHATHTHTHSPAAGAPAAWKRLHGSGVAGASPERASELAGSRQLQAAALLGCSSSSSPAAVGGRLHNPACRCPSCSRARSASASGGSPGVVTTRTASSRSDGGSDGGAIAGTAALGAGTTTSTTAASGSAASGSSAAPGRALPQRPLPGYAAAEAHHPHACVVHLPGALRGMHAQPWHCIICAWYVHACTEAHHAAGWATRRPWLHAWVQIYVRSE